MSLDKNSSYVFTPHKWDWDFHSLCKNRLGMFPTILLILFLIWNFRCRPSTQGGAILVQIYWLMVLIRKKPWDKGKNLCVLNLWIHGVLMFSVHCVDVGNIRPESFSNHYVVSRIYSSLCNETRGPISVCIFDCILLWLGGLIIVVNWRPSIGFIDEDL